MLKNVLALKVSFEMLPKSGCGCVGHLRIVLKEEGINEELCEQPSKVYQYIWPRLRVLRMKYK